MTQQLPKPGQRIELILMVGDPCPVAPGSRGTVLKVSGGFCGSRNIDVAWDNGRTLAVLADIDKWKVLGNE